MQPLARDGFSADRVRAALHGPSREIRFRYDLLSSTNRLKRRLNNVLSASVSNNALAEIKRTARFTLQDDDSIDWLSDRIRPWFRLWIPPIPGHRTQHYLQPWQPVQEDEGGEAGGWAEWPLGVFLLSTPGRAHSEAGVITREVEAYDQLVILRDDKIEDRYTVTENTNFIEAVKTVLDSAGIVNQNLTPTSTAVPVDRDWPPGTPKIEIVNTLLRAINYRSLYFDAEGTAVAEPYVSPADRAAEYVYRDDDQSVIFPNVEQQLDLFGVANKWVLVRSVPDLPPLVSTITNDNPDSPTSTVSRGRVITDFREVEAADQAALDALAERLAFEASQVYEIVELETATMPMHEDADVLELQFTGLGISARYSEHTWDMQLKAGGRMKHRIRRIISI